MLGTQKSVHLLSGFSPLSGDKENHVASVHLTQMVYIWPYFAFFSWPLLYRHYLPATVRPFSYPARYPRKLIVCTTMAVMLVLVRYNTIVHPFTLADNRHYMFYVFRILLRHPLIKYLAVLIYFNCAWVVLSAVGGLPKSRHAPQQIPSPRKRKLPLEEPFQPSPQLDPSPRKRKLPREEPFPPSPQLDPSPMKRSKSQETTLPPSPRRLFNEKVSELQQLDASPPQPPRQQKKQKKQVSGHRASFILIWLLATALSIITTTLVEPRYLIVPWLIWRLHIPSPRPNKDSAPLEKPDAMGKRIFEEVKSALYERYDHRLWLETVWFLTVNLATGYIFLYWGFEWPQEPGKVQRFMW